MSIDSEREDLKSAVEDRVYHFFLREMQERGIDEQEWRYFAIGCAEQFLQSVQIWVRADLVKQDMRNILKEKIINEADVDRPEALSQVIAEVRALKAGDPVPEELLRKMERLWGLE